MGKIRNWLRTKFEGPEQSFTARDFYLMLSYYDTSSLNIAVIGNKSKYNWVIKNLIKQLKEDRHIYKKIIKKSDNHYVFFRGEEEANYIHIENLLDDLQKYKVKYKKFM